MRSRSWIRYKWNTYNDADGGIFTGGRYSICASDNTSGVPQNKLCFESHNILERDFSRFCIYYKVEIHCILTSQRKGERDRSSVQVAGLDCSSREWSNHSFKTDHQTKLSFLVSFFWKSKLGGSTIHGRKRLFWKWFDGCDCSIIIADNNQITIIIVGNNE